MGVMALGPVVELLLLGGQLLAFSKVKDSRTKTYDAFVEKAYSVSACVIQSG